MKEKVKSICLDCFKRCIDGEECNFRPRKELISTNKHHIHPEDSKYKTKKKNSEICVVCKSVVQSFKWVKLKFGYYVFCLDCYKRHLWIAKYVKFVNMG
jgi:hypothetical protein